MFCKKTKKLTGNILTSSLSNLQKAEENLVEGSKKAEKLRVELSFYLNNLK